MLMTDLQLFFDEYGKGVNNITSAISGIGDIWSNVIESREQKELASLKTTQAYLRASYDERKKMEEDLGAKYAEEKTKQAKLAKATAMLEAVVNTAAAVTKLLATPALAVAAGIAGAVQVGVIASEPIPAYAEGGMLPYNGQAQLFMANERGQESILNAKATANLGEQGVNALNRGQSVGNSLTINIQGDIVGLDDNRLNQWAERIAYLSKKGFNTIEVKN